MQTESAQAISPQHFYFLRKVLLFRAQERWRTWLPWFTLANSQKTARAKMERNRVANFSDSANQRAPEILRAFADCGGTRRASRSLQPGRAAFPRRASAYKDGALR